MVNLNGSYKFIFLTIIFITIINFSCSNKQKVLIILTDQKVYPTGSFRSPRASDESMFYPEDSLRKLEEVYKNQNKIANEHLGVAEANYRYILLSEGNYLELINKSKKRVTIDVNEAFLVIDENNIKNHFEWLMNNITNEKFKFFIKDDQGIYEVERNLYIVMF